MPDHNPADTLTAAAKRLTDAVEYFDAVAITRPAALALAAWMNHFAETKYDPEALIVETDRSHELMDRLARALLGGES
jgi:hypothetical protein